jgi:hypothetical protein
MTFPRTLLVAALLATLPAISPAATVSLARSTREVTPEEIAGGAPAGGYVHDFFLTSDTDLLSYSDIKVDVPLFQDLLGSDIGPSAAALAADSYLTTPGSTVVLGGGFADTGGGALWGDLSNDGAQQGFHFARLTTGQTGSFTGRVAVRGYDAPVYLPFNFVLPGNAADLPLLAAESTYSLEYSPEPPSRPSSTPSPGSSMPYIDLVDPSTGPVFSPQTPLPSQPPLLIYPPSIGYPIVDPPSGLPIDPIEPVEPPDYTPTDPLPGDVDDLVDRYPPTEQPSAPENADDPTAPPFVIGDDIITWRPGLGIVRVLEPWWDKIDLTLPVDWEPLVFTRYYDLNGSIDAVASDGVLDLTTIDFTTSNGLARTLSFEAGVTPQVYLFSTASGQTVAWLASEGLIPEPSAGILALSAALGMIATHRRRGRAYSSPPLAKGLRGSLLAACGLARLDAHHRASFPLLRPPKSRLTPTFPQPARSTPQVSAELSQRVLAQSVTAPASSDQTEVPL